jgi:hypothetical protein
VPKRALFRKLKGVLESDELVGVIAVAPIAKTNKPPRADGRGKTAVKKRPIGLTAALDR